MMRSLYSGVSGLKAHQTKMDVIGNNISNISTIGFKGSTVNFSDVFYQTTQNASGPNAATGSSGRNAMQIGLGVNLASITTDITGQGGAQRTDYPLDLMITGDSFFVVNSGGANYFTRAGAFGKDAAGYLCSPYGTVMGWQVDANGTDIVKDTVSPLRVMTPETLYSAPEATTEANISGNINPQDTQMTGSGAKINFNFLDALGNSYNAKLLIKQDAKTNEYTIDLLDVCDSNDQSIFVKKTADAVTGEVKYVASGVSKVSFGGATYELDGTDAIDPKTGKVTLKAPAKLPMITFDSSNGTFTTVTTADGKGTVDDKLAKLTLVIGDGKPNAGAVRPDGLPFSDVNVDFSEITQFGGSDKTALNSAKGSVDGLGAGRKVGSMTGLKVDDSGKIYGIYNNGTDRLLGQIAVATFPNPSGLEAVGNSMFAASLNSGEFDGIGKEPDSEGNSLQSGMLEMSNVDLASEFTNMIVTQRGFQANSKIITTSDTMLEELINLKR